MKRGGVQLAWNSGIVESNRSHVGMVGCMDRFRTSGIRWGIVESGVLIDLRTLDVSTVIGVAFRFCGQSTVF